MAAKYILLVLAAVFVIAALRRMAHDRRMQPQSRTWLIVGIIFAGVSAWLFGRQ